MTPLIARINHRSMDSQFVDCIVTDATGSGAISCSEAPTNAMHDAAAMDAAPTQTRVSRQQNKSQRQRSVRCNVFGCRHNLVKSYDKVSTIF